MTLSAFMGVSRCSMVGIGCTVVVVRVTGVAVGRHAGILSAAVAGLASQGRVGARKRKTGFAVVNVFTVPVGCRMALSAVMRVPGCSMVWIGRAVVVVRVTGIAVGRQPGVLSAAVAGLASQGRVGSGKRKTGFIVVKVCTAPSGCCMALSTVMRKSGRGMVGIGCAVVVVRMTGVAVGRQPGVLSAAVAGLASKRRMGPGKWETGFVVAEVCTAPVGCCVALGAVMRVSGRGMVGIGSIVVVVRVTGIAIGRGSLEYQIRMTFTAVQSGVCAAENESCGAVVIEVGKPIIHAVTCFAIERKSACLVIDRYCIEIIAVVTGVAVCSQSPELADGCTGVAAFTFHCGMRS